jgi:PTS system mannose-specific IIA component
MTGVIVLSHGRLAEEFVHAAVKILGPIERLEAVSIDWDLDASDARQRIEEAIARVGGAAGSVLILTDMFGGTPTNLAISFLDPGRVEVVTGVNLPMLVKFANLRDEGTLREVARRLTEQGRDSIQSASDLLDGAPGGER